MDLAEYVDALRRHLTAAAGAGAEPVRETARVLAETLEPAVRLVLTDALAAMAAELTSRWDGGTVDIRIRGGGPEVVITPAAPAAAPPADASGGPPEEDGAVSRISLRLPESLKSRAEAAAADAGLSLNSWLVRAVATGLSTPPPGAAGPSGTRRITGFAHS